MNGVNFRRGKMLHPCMLQGAIARNLFVDMGDMVYNILVFSNNSRRKWFSGNAGCLNASTVVSMLPNEKHL